MGINVARYTDGFYVSFTASSYDHELDRYIHWYVNGVRYGSQDTIYPGNLTSGGIRISGLTHSTTYIIGARIYWYSGTPGNRWEETYVSTLTINKPGKWYWSNDAIHAFNRGYTTGLHHTEWNNFVDHTRQMYMWYWSLSTENGISSAKMNSSDKILYAWKFNGVRSAIGSMSSTGITEKKKGDNVLGSYFTVMSNSLNAINSPRSVLLKNEEENPLSDDEKLNMYDNLYNISEELLLNDTGGKYGIRC